MLGFDVSERTVLRWMRKAPRNPEPAKSWAAFLSNHREGIAAMDFFAAPTLTFGVLYSFFVIAHDGRRILHCNVTKHPGSSWVVQQLREAFPYDSAPGHLIFDRGSNFNEEVIYTVRSFGIQPKRTQSVAERHCRALGRQLPSGSHRSCHHTERTASETSIERVRCVLPQRPNTSRARKGNTCGSRSREKFLCWS